MLDFTLGLLPSGFNWATAGPLASAAALSASASSGTSLSNSENGADVVDVGSSNAVVVVVVVVDVAGDLDLGVGPNGGLVDLPNLFCCLLPLLARMLDFTLGPAGWLTSSSGSGDDTSRTGVVVSMT